MTQADLFDRPVATRDIPARCGDCVVYCSTSATAGGCSVHGLRQRDEVACSSGHAFGKTQLRMGLYGRPA